MRVLEAGVTSYGVTPFIVDMRGETITCMDHLVGSIYRFRGINKDIGLILLSPAQDHCLRVEHLRTIYNVKEGRPYRLDEVGPLEQVMGYQVCVC